MAYHYEPAGSVSGDYCDFIPAADGSAFFFVGDVTGKGVAASMLVAQLYAIFRSLAASTSSPGELLAKANRIFCEGVLASHFATVLCGRIGKQGQVEISNAGHCLPLHVRETAVVSIPSTGLPLGLLCETDYGTQSLSLRPGDSLILYTDGLTEAFNPSGEQYGFNRLSSVAEKKAALTPHAFLAESLRDLERFRSGARKSDDLTMMVLGLGK
jgi:sigma-B regulation protein RsbU (phosphoserine phosphatase)